MGGSGGGSSGEVGYPLYMETVHGDWLDGSEPVTMGDTYCVTQLMKTAMAASPYTGEEAFDSESARSAIVSAGIKYAAYVDGVSDPTDYWQYIYAIAEDGIPVLSEVTLAAAIAAYDDVVDDRTDTETLPRLQAGYRDINAVNSSAFVVAQSILEGFADRDKNKFAADLRLADAAQRQSMIIKSIDQMTQLLSHLTEAKKAEVQTIVEAIRIATVFAKEETQEQFDIDDKDIRWSLEMFQYGGNVLSSIAGSASRAGKEPSQLQSALGGAMSGAAAGAMVTSGSIPGAIVGGAIGLGASLL